MRVVFLDFDGVLNSQASFLMETRRRKKDERITLGVQHTLCHVCASNFQYFLDQVPDVKIVISSTWRVVHKLSWLKKTMKKYGIDSSRVIGVTPQTLSGYRGREISLWLMDHPEVTDYVIFDDNSLFDNSFDPKFVQTTWLAGLTLSHVYTALKKLGVELNYNGDVG